MRHNYRRVRQNGDTLVEVLIAIAIVSSVLAGAFTVTQKSMQAVRNSQESSEVLGILQGQIELARAAALKTNDADDPLFASSPKYFCMDGSTSARVNLMNLTDNELADVSQYDQDACKGLGAGDLYQVAGYYDEASKTFFFRSTWDSVGGNARNMQVAYRVHSGVSVATAPSSVPPTPSAPSCVDPTLSEPTPQPGKTSMGSLTLQFRDEFNCQSSVNWAVWQDNNSDAYSDRGRGEPYSSLQQQWDDRSNCTVDNQPIGYLTQTARQSTYTSPSSGHTYNWVSCLMVSNYTFKTGYVEVRAKFPSGSGFWPALWTAGPSGIPGNSTASQVAVITTQPNVITMDSNSKSWCSGIYNAPFDTTAGFHAYGIQYSSSGVDFYVDSVKVCHSTNVIPSPIAFMLDLCVRKSPAPSNGAIGTSLIDYIRIWQ